MCSTALMIQPGKPGQRRPGQARYTRNREGPGKVCPAKYTTGWYWPSGHLVWPGGFLGLWTKPKKKNFTDSCDVCAPWTKTCSWPCIAGTKKGQNPGRYHNCPWIWKERTGRNYNSSTDLWRAQKMNTELNNLGSLQNQTTNYKMCVTQIVCRKSRTFWGKVCQPKTLAVGSHASLGAYFTVQNSFVSL